MESQLYSKKALLLHILKEMIEACDLITLWNADIANANVYPQSPAGMKTMAASCMLIESIGEGIKKIDKLVPGYLVLQKPAIPWKNIMGLRDRIAHGYFNLDADIIFDVAVNEIPLIKKNLVEIKSKLEEL